MIKELQLGPWVLRSLEEISEHVYSFYKKFYRFDALTGMNIRARTACLKSIPRLVMAEQNAELLQPFMEEDFEEALKQLLAGKAAHKDEIPTKALKLLWPKVGPLIV